MFVENLIDEIEQEGVKLEDRADVRNSLYEALFNNRFKFIFDSNSERIGFVSWIERYEKGRLYIFINNLLIKKEHRGKFNLMKIITMLRKIYPNITAFYWKSRKKDKVLFSFQRRLK